MVPQLVHANLAEKATLQQLSDSCYRASQNLADQDSPLPNILDPDDEPIQPLITAIVGDGAPVYLSSKLTEETVLADAQAGRHSLAKWFFGGMHFLIESLIVFGRLFQEGHGHTSCSYEKTLGRWTW
jgi:hypothetical protein